MPRAAPDRPPPATAPSPAVTAISTLVPNVRLKSLVTPSINSLTSTTLGCSGWRRAKASSRRVSSAPRSAAVSASLANSSRPEPLVSSSRSRSRLPITTLSRLLKSCASPPVRLPMASIFIAWRSWSSTDCSASAARFCSVMSLDIATRYLGRPSSSNTGIFGGRDGALSPETRVDHLVGNHLQLCPNSVPRDPSP